MSSEPLQHDFLFVPGVMGLHRGKMGPRKGAGGNPSKGKANGKRKNGGGSGAATRSTANRVLAQGVGRTAKAWGSRTRRGRNVSMQCWNALSPCHLPLPRSVGPYTVFRANARFSSTDKCAIIGAFQDMATNSDLGDWCSTIAVTSVIPANNMYGSLNAKRFTMPLDGLGGGATLVPSAVTVQIMCPKSLQTAEGTIYAGVMNTQAAVSGRVESWESYFDRFVQFQAPRMMSSGKLVLRGVTASSYPLNMTEVAKFTPLVSDTAGTFTFNSSSSEPTGWAPIMVYNVDGVQLEYLVTVEYRVRFDLTNPAAGSHTHHSCSTDGQWDSAIKQASSLGHGVMDIADAVANAGAGISKAYGAYTSTMAAFA